MGWSPNLNLYYKWLRKLNCEVFVYNWVHWWKFCSFYTWILKKFVPWKPVSEVFYTSNTLSISLCSSVQIRHCCVNFTTDNEGIRREKAAWKLALSMKDKSYTRDCTKQTSKIPRLQNIDLNLFTITFHLSLFTKPAPLWLLLLLLIFSKRACVFFLRAF